MEHANLEGDAYYSDTSLVSRSMLEDFRVSPALYHGRYITKTIDRTESAALRFGIAYHEQVLEGGLVRTAVMPEFSGKGSVAQKAEWSAEHVGKNIIGQDDYDQILAMLDALLSAPQNEWAKASLFGLGENEKTIVFEIDGLPMKARLDRMILDVDRGMVIDAKSHRENVSSHEWQKEVYVRGYHRQAWIYVEAAKALHPNLEWSFAHVVQSKQAPYDAKAFELPPSWLALGEKHTRESIAWLKECQETGVWASKEALNPIVIDGPAPWMK